MIFWGEILGHHEFGKPRVRGPILLVKNQFGAFQSLNNKKHEFENFAKLEPQVCEGLLYMI